MCTYLWKKKGEMWNFSSLSNKFSEVGGNASFSQRDGRPCKGLHLLRIEQIRRVSLYRGRNNQFAQNWVMNNFTPISQVNSYIPRPSVTTNGYRFLYRIFMFALPLKQNRSWLPSVPWPASAFSKVAGGSNNKFRGFGVALIFVAFYHSFRFLTVKINLVVWTMRSASYWIFELIICY